MPELTRFSVKGFKSIKDSISIQLPGLTIIAGANSCGKSSAIQPLLLLKQTLQSQFQPSELRLSGPNIKFSDPSQLFWNAPGTTASKRDFSVALENGIERVTFGYEYENSTKLKLKPTVVRQLNEDKDVKFDTTQLSLREDLKNYLFDQYQEDHPIRNLLTKNITDFEVSPGRIGHTVFYRFQQNVVEFFDPGSALKSAVARMIHLPGLRGNPERTYPRTGVSNDFAGVFHDYFASLLHSWKSGEETGLRKAVAKDLRTLGLGWKVETKSVDAVSIEVKVTRLPNPRQHGARDFVSLADTGIGVSQVLPIITSLHAAQSGQLIYIEQPEIHLHPRAQQSLADVFYSAVQRGVRLIVETHSETLIEALLSLVAEGDADPRLMSLYWVSRNEDGVSEFRQTEIKPGGRLQADFPMDFSSVRREILQRRLLSNFPED